MQKLSQLSLILTTAFLASHTSNVLASDNYPNRPIKLVVPFTPGGSTDFVARLIGEKLTERTGQTLVIENRPGAGGTIGANYSAKAKPDGYTLFAGHVGTLSINPGLYKKLSYEPATDFAPITAMVQAPLVLVVSPQSSVHTVGDLIKEGKTKQHGLTYSTAGAGSAAHLASELFSSMTGISATHIPYKGTADATNAVAAGDVDFNFSGQKPSQPLIEAKRLRSLGLTSLERMPGDAGEALVSETVANYEVQNWHGIVAPAGTPQPIIDFLNKEVTAILQMPQVRKTLADYGYETIPMTPQAFSELIANDRKKWKAVIDRAGLMLE